jgi:predicted TIM-barrel fold metal-dependent hydrolase
MASMSRRRIDVHTHYLGGVVARFAERANPKITGGYQIKVRWSPEAAIEFMDRYEIAAQIMSLPSSFSGPPGVTDFAVRFTRELNEEYAALIKDYPGRFGAFAAVPVDTPEHALAEIEYALDVLGLDGVVLTSNADGKYFGQPFYEPILAELAHRGVPVFVHPEDSPHIDELGFGRPSSVIEFPVDTARALTNAIYTGVFQRHPGLTLILAHCGGVLPTLGWRIGEHTEMGRGPEDADIGPSHVADVLRGLYYETALAGSRNSLLPTLEVTGPDHILFGTDWPAAAERTVVHNITNLTTFEGFTQADLAGVDRANAARLFPRLA